MCCRILTKSIVWGSAEHKITCEKYIVDAAHITDDLIKTKLRDKMPEGDSSFKKAHAFVENA